MAERKQAIVVGALGVIGRYIVERLLKQDDWYVIGLSRRAADETRRYRHVSVDLLNIDDTSAKLAGLTEATHVFYAAFAPAAGAASDYASNVAPNRDMLINAVTAIDAASAALRRMVLVTGTKYYGSHLGPFKTPARESDPRHMPPDYYFDQIDWLIAFQRGKRWDWVELRPQTLCGFAPGTPMSLAPAIAVYAATEMRTSRKVRVGPIRDIAVDRASCPKSATRHPRYTASELFSKQSCAASAGLAVELAAVYRSSSPTNPL